MLKKGNRSIVGTHGGGPFVSFVLETMRQRIANENRKKFIHISGHDTTIISVLTALRLTEDYPELCTKPLYASALMFELRRVSGASSGKYNVQILYKNGLVGKFEPLALKTLAKKGCDLHCPYDTFTE